MFSFKGRAGLREYWRRTLLGALVFTIITVVLMVGAGVGMVLLATREHWPQWVVDGAGVLAVLLQLANAVCYGWLMLAVSIRRMHDLGVSGGSMFSLAASWRSWFSRGTVGPNPYGADPLA